MDAEDNREPEEGSEPIYKKLVTARGQAVRAAKADSYAPEVDDEDEDFEDELDDEAMEELSGDDDDSCDMLDIPDYGEALRDPTFIAMANYMLNAARQLHNNTTCVVTKDAADGLAEWVYEWVWATRMAPLHEDQDPSQAAPDFK